MPKRVWLKVAFVDDMELTIDRQFRHIYLERKTEDGKSDVIAHIDLVGKEYLDVVLPKTHVRIVYKFRSGEIEPSA